MSGAVSPQRGGGPQASAISADRPRTIRDGEAHFAVGTTHGLAASCGFLAMRT